MFISTKKQRAFALAMLVAPAACGEETGSGGVAPDRYEGKLFEDLSAAEAKELCAAVKADLAPMEKDFDRVYCMGRAVGRGGTEESCEQTADQCFELHELDKAKDPNCEEDHELCEPLTRVDEYLRCVQASKKAIAAAVGELNSCDPEQEFELETPEECKTFSVNVHCGHGGVIDSWGFYW